MFLVAEKKKKYSKNLFQDFCKSESRLGNISFEQAGVKLLGKFRSRQIFFLRNNPKNIPEGAVKL